MKTIYEEKKRAFAGKEGLVIDYEVEAYVHDSASDDFQPVGVKGFWCTCRIYNGDSQVYISEEEVEDAIKMLQDFQKVTLVAKSKGKNTGE